MFEQYAGVLQQELPTVDIHGETYPPTKLARTLSNIVFFLRMLLLAAILGGPGALNAVGINHPPSCCKRTQVTRYTITESPRSFSHNTPSIVSNVAQNLLL